MAFIYAKSANLVNINLPAKNHFYKLPKGPLSGLRQFLTTETSLKMMKNAIYFMLKVLFVLKIFTFLS